MNDLTNYTAYSLHGHDRIGSLSLESSVIQPLSHASGTPLTNLYEVIEVGEAGIIASGSTISLHDVTLKAPISGRDVLAVGKNYAEHAIEFNKSGYDASDKTDQPTHPVIFTKRETSIMAHGDEIFTHKDFTKTLDYEGEIGVIIGKSGFRITEQDAMQHVWGYTIINDVTARERQRDHKQFYIGKSPDTFCPMGPIAVPASRLEKDLRVQTFVNGEKRQDSTTKDLIFSIPFLVHTLSEGITIQPGDVIATGTPAGVGFGQDPPVWLKSGDVVEVSVTGLGTLSNKISSSSINPVEARVAAFSHLSTNNIDKSVGGTVGLTSINKKPMFCTNLGDSSKPPVVFVHGLGGTSEFYTSLISSLGLEKTHSIWLYDLEGHGRSPSKVSSVLSIESFAKDLVGVFRVAGIKSGATLVAHSMGCLVAMQAVLTHPELVKKLVLFGPPPTPLPEAGSKGAHARAALAREKGMGAVVDAVVTAGTSQRTKDQNPLAIATTRISILSQDPECYAKACSALANATTAIPIQDIKATTLIVTGSDDKVSPPALCKEYAERIPACNVKVLEGVGHWHIFEDLKASSDAIVPAL